MDLGTTFACSVAREPEAVALVDGGLRLSYAAWERDIRALAGGLKGFGLEAGDRVVAVLSNRHETATLYWACQYLGLVFTPFNWRASGADVAFVLDDAEAAIVVYEPRSEQAMGEAVEKTGFDRARLVAVGEVDGGARLGELAAAPPIAGPVAPPDEAISLMLYTSGTTGRPKGVPRSHAAERSAAVACLGQLGYRYGESALGVMPLFHTMGIRVLLTSALLNGKFVCMAAFDAGEAMRTVERERISSLFLVPTMFHDMVSLPDFAAHDVSTVRNIAYAGMAMTSALTKKCAELFAPEIFCNFYGSSEIFTFSVCDHVVDKPGCAGRAGFGQVLRIVRAEADGGVGADETVAAGEAGEIIASMASQEAFTGYWKRPDADAKAIRDGWYFTGDLGRLDEDGELHVVGRVDDMIISGGENIYPEEVEDVLDGSALVGQAAVIGVADARLGEKVVAFVEPASLQVSAEALDAVCLESGLARFKRPRAYVFVDALPRSASGKLLRRHLRAGDYRLLPDFDSTL